MERLPLITVVYDRRKASKHGRSAMLEIRITHNGRQKYLSTGIKVYPGEWKKGEVVGRNDAAQLNLMLSKLVMEVRKRIMAMAESDGIDIFSLELKPSKQVRGRITLREFLEQRAAVRVYGHSKACSYRYSRLLKVLGECGVIRDFSDITDSNILKFDRYLKERGLKESSIWGNYHKIFNSLIADAADEGYLSHNPYKKVNIPRKRNSGESLYRYITPSELQRLEDSTMPTLSLERVRDLFLFQTYTCLSYTDLMSFDASRITETSGMKVYTGKRGKTGKAFTIPLLPIPLSMLSKYGNKLPSISNVKYNLYLKEVARLCNIKKPISSHWARHTGATLLLNKGIGLEIVSRICGHSSVKITEQVYARLLDETVVKAVKEIDK